MIRKLLALSLTLLLTSAIPAQFAGPGLTWYAAGGNAGTFVPSCANLPVAAVRGESVTLTVWGDPMALFALFAAGSGTQCQPIPGLGNALVLDPPILTVSIGVLTQLTPCLSCPPGFEQLGFAIPRTVALGTSVSLQAVSYGAGRPAFTAAITGTVR